jgi:hypothetical protein
MVTPALVSENLTRLLFLILMHLVLSLCTRVENTPTHIWGGVYICPISLHVQVGNMCTCARCEMEMCFLHIPTPSFTARDHELNHYWI